MDRLIELPYNLAGRIFRSPMPYSPYFDPWDEVLAGYQRLGVNVVVMLTPMMEARDITGFDLHQHYIDHGYQVIHAPVQDFDIPHEGQFSQAVPMALSAANAGQTIAMHCHAGIGRTGTFAACLARLVFQMDGDQAIAWVRRYVPGALENEMQMQFVRDFEL